MTRTSKVYWALLGLFGLALFVHVQFLGGGLRDLTVADEFTYDQSLDITGSVGRINLLMYIPTPRLGLEIRNEKIETADLDRETPAGGLVVVGGQRGGRERHIRYRAQLSSLALTFTLDPDQPWTTAAPGDSVWLAATDVIQSDHPDLARLLATLVGVEATPGLEELGQLALATGTRTCRNIVPASASPHL